MPLTEEMIRNLDLLFEPVGFEGLPDSEKNTSLLDSHHETIENDNQDQQLELDDDIQALLDLKPETVDTPQQDEDVSQLDDEEEEFGFLDAPVNKSTIKSRYASKQQEQSADIIIPVENNTITKNITFNQTISKDRINEIFLSFGDDPENDDYEEYSYLDGEKKSNSRLMSRVRQPVEKEIEQVENNTIPQNIKFNINISQKSLSLLLVSIGEINEEITEKSQKTSYLEEQAKSNSRLMSRIKQVEQKEIQSIENNTIPKNILFNLSIPSEKIKTIFKSIGE